MEYIDEPKPETPEEIINYKRYELNIKEDNFLLEIKLFSDNYISFKLKKLNNISLYYYMEKYNYNDISKILLNKKEYFDLSEIILLFDKAIENKNINLIYDKNNKIMNMKIKRIIDSKDIEHDIKLKEKKFTNEEILKTLIEKENSKDPLINNLIKKNKENEEHINQLEDKIKILEHEIKNYKIFWDDKLKSSHNPLYNNGINNMISMNKNKEIMEENKNSMINYDNNLMNNQTMFNQPKNEIIMNNFENNNKDENNNNNKIISILFYQDWCGRTICVNCNIEESNLEVIQKYREISKDLNQNREFIYNARKIDFSKKVSESELSNFSKINVSPILSHEIQNGVLVNFKLDNIQFPPILIDSNQKFEKAITALYNLKYSEINQKKKYKYYFNNKKIELSKTLNELGITNNSIINIK